MNLSRSDAAECGVWSGSALFALTTEFLYESRFLSVEKRQNQRGEVEKSTRHKLVTCESTLQKSFPYNDNFYQLKSRLLWICCTMMESSEWPDRTTAMHFLICFFTVCIISFPLRLAVFKFYPFHLWVSLNLVITNGPNRDFSQKSKQNCKQCRSARDDSWVL